jgi:hypothetical protein
MVRLVAGAAASHQVAAVAAGHQPSVAAVGVGHRVAVAAGNQRRIAEPLDAKEIDHPARM